MIRGWNVLTLNLINQIIKIISKVVKPTNKETLLLNFGDIVINRPLSPLSTSGLGHVSVQKPGPQI